MKKYLILFLSLSVVIVLYYGCEDRNELTTPSPPSTGSANFTKFVSIGNSLTAGYQSGSLYESAQMYTFGNLIAKQVGVTYEQPLMGDPGTGGRLEVQALTATGITLYANPNVGMPKNATLARPYNNLGVPGAFLYDVMNATNANNCYTGTFAGTPNPMFDLVLRNSALNIGSQFKQAAVQAPTFVTLWIGNNDILGHATAGGTIPFTPTTSFAGLYKQLLDTLASTGVKVVVANIPDVTAIPFFTTVGATLKALGISALWAVRGTGDTIPLSTSSNYFTLKSSDLIAAGKGTAKTNPIPSSVVLDSVEAANVKSVITNYNTTIASLAAGKNFGVVDIHTIFNDIAKNGIVVNGVSFNAAYVTGGLFSLDGVHPTSRGQGIIANEFIKAINSKFGANISLVNVSTIPGSISLKKEVNKLGLPVIPPGALDNLLF
ncbi:MAG: hypothetical protein KKF98_07715 [Bacteroidetes bacterium]|nr:hypothetical protein [Bacteroidota bacterium]